MAAVDIDPIDRKTHREPVKYGFIATEIAADVSISPPTAILPANFPPPFSYLRQLVEVLSTLLMPTGTNILWNLI